MDSRNVVGNNTGRAFYELKITFRSSKDTQQRLQTLESIVTSNHSSTTTLLETWEEHIYINSGRIWTVEMLLEIIQDVLI